MKGNCRNGFLQLRTHVLFQTTNILFIDGLVGGSYLQCFGKTYDAIHVFGTGTQVTLLSAAKNKRLDADAFIYVQDAGALWAMKLVTGSRNKMHVQLA